MDRPSEHYGFWESWYRCVGSILTLLPPSCGPGWMHAGYPIMCHLESVQELINEKLIRTKGLWGPVHELGRNQQRQEWEFPPHTTEATCNLWCVYVHETVLGIPRGRANIALWPPVREKRVRIYLGKGPNVKNWNAWTALETYLQVLGSNGGGWEPPTQGTGSATLSGDVLVTQET